jgi:triosephosphate isomerase
LERQLERQPERQLKQQLKRQLKPPFFEIGPKQYLYGDEVLELARMADEASIKHGVQVIFTAPFPDIRMVAQNTESLIVFAPSMDDIPVGRMVAGILPESIRAAGAEGVMLNHVEKPLAFAKLESTARRAKSLGLLTLICAESSAELKAAALLAPDVIAAEPADLIGTGKPGDLGFVLASKQAVRSIDERVYVLIGAGVSTGEDVYKVIKAGADASGSSSAIARARDKRSLLDEFLGAARQAWDERAGQRAAASG